MNGWREVHVQLAHEEWFDIRAGVDGSNQRAKDGWFRMQVRQVEGWEFFDSRHPDRLMVHGRRYKPSGELSERVATARIAPSQLPSDVRLVVNQLTDGFR